MQQLQDGWSNACMCINFKGHDCGYSYILQMDVASYVDTCVWACCVYVRMRAYVCCVCACARVYGCLHVVCMFCVCV